MSMACPRPLIAGNWKMNGNKHSIHILKSIIEGYNCGLQNKTELLICPPATLTMMFSAATHNTGIAIGGQDCHFKASGAHTGDIAAVQLADAGASYVIVGHSERRSAHGESDAVVCAKAIAGREAGLIPVVCIGETQAQREEGQALNVIRTQLDASLPETADGTNLVVAYEPVWAIGTGLTPTPEQVGEVHKVIRDVLVERYDSAGFMIRILYGGSVKPNNAASLLGVSNVDGALVGGASLEAKDFLGIAAFYR